MATIMTHYTVSFVFYFDPGVHWGNILTETQRAVWNIHSNSHSYWNRVELRNKLNPQDHLLPQLTSGCWDCCCV